MTDEMMTLRSMLEKGTDADVLREMIGFASERLMEMEIQALTGAGHGERSADHPAHRTTATANATGRPGPGLWSCVSRSCAKAAIFPAFWSRAGWRRRR
jgi:hypothetical protein